jgi:nitrite reductase/ring-hydroxylating ferredoxin subunit
VGVEFQYAGTLDELKSKGRLVVRGPHRPILLIHDRDRVYALDNRCPHMGFPLERASMDDGILTCHWHHARFDLASGCTFDLWADDVPTCPIEVRGAEVWVKAEFAHDDPSAYWRSRLQDAMAHNLPLVIAKAVQGQLAAGVPALDIVRQAALFGAHNRNGWSTGMTILTALGNLVAILPQQEIYLALVHGVRRVAADCDGAAPPRKRAALASRPDAGTLKRWLRRWTAVRHGEGAQRTVLTAIAMDAPPTLLAPGNGATAVATTPAFSWTAVSGNGATGSYRIQVATNAADLSSDPDGATCGASCAINTTTSTTGFNPATALTANTTYTWQVHALGTTLGGTWSTRFSFTTAGTSAGLSATTTAPTNVTGDSATLNGTVNPNGVAVSAYFEYGTSLAYGQKTATVLLPAGTGNVPVSYDLTGLTPNTTYHYRMIATDGGTTVSGIDATFIARWKGVDYSSVKSSTIDACLFKDGNRFVGRYYDASGGTSKKSLTAPELTQLHDSGLKVAVFYESCGGATTKTCTSSGVSYFTYQQGRFDAGQAKARANQLNQPFFSPIFFAVDYDASGSDLQSGLTDYFNGVNDMMAGAYPIGVYGSYRVVEYAHANWQNVVSYWQTYAWSGSSLSSYASAYQWKNAFAVTACKNTVVDQNLFYVEVGW